MAWTGVGRDERRWNLIGPTDGRTAAAMDRDASDSQWTSGRNVIHGSDGEDTSAFELGLWFPEGLVDWSRDAEKHIYGDYHIHGEGA